VPDGRPLHAQLSTLLRGRILTGVYKPGERIESEERLASHFGVSRATVRHAIEALAGDGFVVARRGAGTFVSDPLPHRLRAAAGAGPMLTGFLDDLFLEAATGVREQDYQLTKEPATTEVAEALGCRAGTAVVMIRRVRVIDGQVVGWAEDAVAAHVGRHLTPSVLRAAPSVLHALSRAGFDPAYASQEISAAAADDATALDVAPGTPLIEIRGTLNDATMRPLDAYRHLMIPGQGPHVEYIRVGTSTALAGLGPT
jgi:GntR family transcriptional regulator